MYEDEPFDAYAALTALMVVVVSWLLAAKLVACAYFGG